MQEKFRVILECSKLYMEDPGLLERLWGGCGEAICSLATVECQLGLGEEASGRLHTSDRQLNFVHSTSIGNQHVLFQELFLC